MSAASKHKHGLHQHRHDARGFVRDVVAACDRRGLRLTPLRLRVLELVADDDKPVKAYALLDRLKDDHAGAAPPTVYRALDFLLENGFIHKIESLNSYVSCHHPDEAHQVPFLICDACASAVEICDEQVATLLSRQASEHGFQPRAQTLEVHGLCASCAKSA